MKAVTKIMVEGKDFFDGDSKIASKNIPSNAVDKVQILKNYAEVGQLSSVQNNHIFSLMMLSKLQAH